jgi:undecaprenyl diphosphate synthase
MGLFVSALEHQVKRLHDNNVRLKVVGDLDAFSDKLRRLIEDGEAMTASNSGLHLNIAANYGGRWDIAQATRVLGKQIATGELRPEDITADHIEEHLTLSALPEPDLFIRTGGEQRVSNFLLWQLAYTELYFTEVLWPDFDEENFDAALVSYGSRQRRFGRTGNQVADKGSKTRATSG